MRDILHVDMDAFYAAVEVLDDPRLRGRPVVVGGTPEGRGVVSTASYEARKLGVRSAMSAWQARKLAPQAVFLPPRMGRYAEVSRQVFAILERFTPLVEPLSIDEAFLDVTGCATLFGPPVKIARTIKESIRGELGLTASVGVAGNKFLAKVASDLGKPDGLVVIAPGEAERVLAPLPAARLIGVGKVAEARLARAGIHTIADVLRAGDATLEAALGSWGRELKALARGEDARPVVPGGEPKSIGAETTFARDLADTDALVRELDGLVDEVGRRLRQEGYRGRTVQLKARFPDFSTVTRARTLPAASAASAVLRRVARELLLGRLDRRSRPLRLLGVQVSNLEPAGAAQPRLFGPAPEERAEGLDRVADRLREKFGVRAAQRAAEMDEGEGPEDEG